MQSPDPITGAPSRRRLFLTSLLAGVSALWSRAGRSQDKPQSPDLHEGEAVTARVRRGDPPRQPLDSMMVFERGDNNNGRAMTHEVLSLIHQEKGKNSYPWTLYTSLETHHEQGDACSVCSRLHKHGPGWSTGLHSEVFSHSRAVAIGANIEMSCDYVGTEATQVIGLNIQAVGGPTPMQYAIQVHDGAGHFETGIGLRGKGNTGLDINGKYDVGLNAHSNSIRVSEGTCVELEETGKIRIRYLKGRIEFLNGDRCVGHIDVNGADHAL